MDIVVVAPQIGWPVVNERLSSRVRRALSPLVWQTAVILVKEAFFPVLPFKPFWALRSQDVNGRQTIVFFLVRRRSLSSDWLVSKDFRGRTVPFFLSFLAGIAAFANRRLGPSGRVHVRVVPEQYLWRSLLVDSELFLLQALHWPVLLAAAALSLASGSFVMGLFAAGAAGSGPSAAALSLGALAAPLGAGSYWVRWHGHRGIQSLLRTVETIHGLHGRLLWLLMLHHGGALPYSFCEKD